MRWIVPAVLIGVFSQSFLLKPTARAPPRLHAHSFRENSNDGVLLRKIHEVRTKLQLDSLTVRELRVQIKDRGGLSKGLYEKDELVRHLAYLIGTYLNFSSLITLTEHRLLIVLDREQEEDFRRKEVKNKDAKAQHIISKKRLMKNMTTEEIRDRLERAGVPTQLYRSREDLESALALLWMGELEGSVDDDLARLQSDWMSAVGNLTSSLQSAIDQSWSGSSLKEMIVGATMTDAERTAREIVSSNASFIDVDEADVDHAREAFESVETFDEACEICEDLPKPLMIRLLTEEFNIHVDDTLPRSKIASILSDSVMLKRKIVRNYESPLNTSFEAVPPSNIFNKTQCRHKESKKTSSQSIRESVLFPERDALPWLRARVGRLLGGWREASVSSGLTQIFDDKISSGIHNLLSTVSSLGVEAACGLAMWAAGDRARVPGTLLVSCLLTMITRRGILFFFEILLAIRVVRVGLYGSKEGEDSARSRRPGVGVQTVVMAVFAGWYLLALSRSVRSFPTQKLFSRGIGFR